MVVEDHPDSRELLRQVLEPLATRVLLAENGYEALALLRTDRRLPDVILCDLLMPAMDGLNFARRLQQEPEPFHGWNGDPARVGEEARAPAHRAPEPGAPAPIRTPISTV